MINVATKPRQTNSFGLREMRTGGASMLLQQAAKRFNMQITLEELMSVVPNSKIVGKKEIRIQSLATDSRRVTQGALFIAMPGIRTDGKFFVEEAINRGAVAVVSETPVWVPPRVANVVVPNLRHQLGVIAARFYGNPDKEISLTGILGTSGKTVVSHLLRYLKGDDEKVGMLGTIHYAVGRRTLPAYRTTPEPVDLHAMFSQMRESGSTTCLLEISSHAIDQGRTAGVSLDTVVFLNLTPEHLHYHGSMEAYFSLEQAYITQQAKSARKIILNVDDKYGKQILEQLPAEFRSKALTFGICNSADIRAEKIEYSQNDTRFNLVYPGGEMRLVSPMVGSFNVENVLAAFAVLFAEGHDLATAAGRLLDFGSVRGRMEKIEGGQKFGVVVDYMHTEESYRKGLEMLRDLTKGKLITVFGCGGNRDAGIRPVITKTVSSSSDIVIATSDNPRNESVESIFQDMRKGNESAANISYIEDRRQAIFEALSMAGPDDLVLIAGKGHETYQEYGDCVVPFDDRAVAREIIKDMQA